jgi:hypothetical protein
MNLRKVVDNISDEKGVEFQLKGFFLLALLL